MNEVREEIDKIDQQIIALFSKRMKYVDEIVRFKQDEEGVIAAARKDQVLQNRARWAEEKGLDPEVFQQMYSLLIEKNIQHELALLNQKMQDQQ